MVLVKVLSKNLVRLIRNRDPSEKTEAVISRFDSVGINTKVEKSGDETKYFSDFYVIKEKGGLVEIKDNNGLVLFRELSFKAERGKVIWSHILVDDVRLYGFGEKNGPLDKRKWKRIVLRNRDPVLKYRSPETDPLYLNIPFYIMAKKGYAVGVYIDSPSYMVVHIGGMRKNTITIEKVGHDLDVYIILGRNIREVLEGYIKITGTPYMPPLWALGFHQSKWSYMSEKEVFEVATKLRELGIPCDVIHLDIDYMDKFKMFTWDRKRFPRPKHMIEKLHKMGFKVVTIMDPYIKVDENYDLFSEGLRKGYFAKDKRGGIFKAYGWSGKSAIPDFFNEEVRKWWGELYLDFHKKYGVDGFKNDMNEPSVETRLRVCLGLGAKPSNIVFCEKEEHLKIEEVGNIYALLECMCVYNALRKTGKRFFLLSRSGFAGIQRYAANWTGDVWSSWKHLKASISMILNMSLSGLFFTGADIGGFLPPFRKASRDLYLRWLQLGVFYPFMRVHYAKRRPSQEPWCFGDKALRIVKKYIELRYRLLLYIYSLFRRAHVDGELIFRPLFYDFPDDERSYDIDDQFMFGPSLLVAPILHKENFREVYLPEGYWLDFWSHRIYLGAKTITYNADLETIPIFVRDGGILIMQESQNYVGKKRIEAYDVMVFSKEKSGKIILYEDDGVSYDFEKEAYTETEITSNPDSITIRTCHEGYEGAKFLRLRIFSDKKPKKIIVDGEGSEFSYNEKWIQMKITKMDHEIDIIA